ncbi:FAS1-like dehydratase domain-containing protein [Roseovarius sp. 2305UL8-3]|uniref:FAS1-like dehydratase domain-containing protein n=1 Tax=Roseovarius conchicola TaxID=3121636 RepID=UPI0035293D4F
MQTIRDVMDPDRARAMQATLGQTPQITAGDVLPAFFHQLYFWEPQPPERLGRDGHPKLGGLIPEMGLPRRMWAGGRLEFHAALRVGLDAEKRSVCERATRKTGRTGPLAFVTLRHEIWQDGRLCVTDWQDVVYREDPDLTAPRPVPPLAATDETQCETASFNTTLLFRYSALTFNGHRIHYDRDYARDVEGYDGLVVHGPLLAQLLMQMAERRMGKLNSFRFRATAPLMDYEIAELCWNEGRMWVRGPDGRQCLEAEAG